ncbi:hypothetical protein [Luteibacter aegosomatissinici]|jgi:hypothetical protein|uniref:hypothetical protein n=1 Tax=Luteibacter aegosomatissinici TaxID=2911539 RepID=UPI001FFAB01F|nr:hypothetical protein [Luteibacter aegosomatissinici]UPG93157.1 hypothetical protein L2Y97_14965 [Luteibacter aegosomatissinici]
MVEDSGIHSAGTYAQRAATLPQSGLGVASFVIALVSGLAVLGGITLSAVLISAGDTAEHMPLFGLIGLVLIFFLLMALVGTVLALVALRRQDRRRTFAAIGLGLNVFILLGTGAMMALGTVLRHSNS